MLNTTRFKALLLTGVLSLGLLTACGAPTASGTVTTSNDSALFARAAGEAGSAQNAIYVTGTGTVYAAPDMATIQIGVQGRNSDPKTAVSDTNQRMNAILATLKELGIEDKDLRTTNISLSAQADYDPVTGQPKGTYTFVSENTLSVTVRDLGKIGDALGRAVDAGANNIYGVSFGVSDPARLEADARAQAMADAKSRADQLAGAAGVGVGAPISISESVYTPQPQAYLMEGARLAADVASVPVSSGQLQITVQVNVTYAIP
jgi:hypothetical protein